MHGQGTGAEGVRAYHRRSSSAAAFGLRDVAPDLFDVAADDGANERAAAIVNGDGGNAVKAVLQRHGTFPVDDVDLANGDIRIAVRHLLQMRRHEATGAAPVGVKINDCHPADGEMSVDIDTLAVSDHLDRLARAPRRR